MALCFLVCVDFDIDIFMQTPFAEEICLQVLGLTLRASSKAVGIHRCIQVGWCDGNLCCHVYVLVLLYIC